MKKYESAVNFLLSQADIAIKYRVIDEICNDKNSVEHFKLKNELINSERAKRLIE